MSKNVMKCSESHNKRRNLMIIKNKKVFIAASIIAAISISVTGTLAFLTDTKEITNTITVGDVSIELTEPNYDASLYTALCPKQEIKKDPTVKNTGSAPAYIKIDVLIPTVPAGVRVVNSENSYALTKELFSYEINDGWTAYGEPEVINEENEDESKVYTRHSYVFDTPLKSTESTPALFDNVVLANITSGQTVCGETVDIPIIAYGIQSDGLTLDEAFSKYEQQAEVDKNTP